MRGGCGPASLRLHGERGRASNCCGSTAPERPSPHHPAVMAAPAAAPTVIVPVPRWHPRRMSPSSRADTDGVHGRGEGRGRRHPYPPLAGRQRDRHLPSVTTAVVENDNPGLREKFRELRLGHAYWVPLARVITANDSAWPDALGNRKAGKEKTTTMRYANGLETRFIPHLLHCLDHCIRSLSLSDRLHVPAYVVEQTVRMVDVLATSLSME